MGNPEVEPGARLSCHLLLRIFQSLDSAQPAQYSPGSPASSGGGGGGTAQRALPGAGGRATQRSVRLSCDRHLLVAARLSFSMEPVLAFLKVAKWLGLLLILALEGLFILISLSFSR